MSQSTHASPAGAATEEHGEGHGSIALYIWIGVILAILTFVEVAVYFIEAFASIKVPLMILLSVAKLVLVVMYFMHLKMDHRSLTWIFISGAVLAVFMIAALLVLYQVLPRFA